MAKYALRIKAREMRSKGESVNTIAQKLGVSKGTVSLWVRDIILSIEQLERLRKNSIKGAELGRLRGALVQKRRRMRNIQKARRNGIKTVNNLSERELLLVGTALYWAEGSKKSCKLFFCNSDPKMINFYLKWLKDCFGITNEELTVSVGINHIHKEREEEVKKYWSEITSIPLSQFRSTIYIKSKNKKVYENHDSHFGTFRVNVLKPSRFYNRIMGLIHGLGEITTN